MKVCVFGLRGFPQIQGGVEKHCETLYSGFNPIHHFIVFRRKSYIASDIHYLNITFIDLLSTRIKGLETVLYSFLAAIYTAFRSPDIVHIHNIGPALFAPIVRMAGLRVVLTYHSPNYEHAKWGWFARNLLKLSEKIAFLSAHAVIFVNKFQMEKAITACNLKNAVYIPNGIPNVVTTDSTDYLELLGVEAGKYILSVGRITQEKGFDLLIEAFKEVELAPDIKLVIAGGVEGEEEYARSIKRLAGHTDRIVFTGYMYGDKLCQLYSHAMLYVLTSRNEGFPLVLLEAMSYGLDVLVSDIPATHLVELAAEDYFTVNDKGALVRRLQAKTKEGKRRTYNLAGYNWQDIRRQTEEVYLNVIQRRS
jgi:glycosyltransferase involved in cell wall biosynthesis